MPRRLTDRFRHGDRVEILLTGHDGPARWVPGIVQEHDYPGIWVLTSAGNYWYVTNGRHIRLQEQDPGDTSPPARVR